MDEYFNKRVKLSGESSAQEGASKDNSSPGKVYPPIFDNHQDFLNNLSPEGHQKLAQQLKSMNLDETDGVLFNPVHEDEWLSTDEEDSQTSKPQYQTSGHEISSLDVELSTSDLMDSNSSLDPQSRENTRAIIGVWLNELPTTHLECEPLEEEADFTLHTALQDHIPAITRPPTPHPSFALPAAQLYWNFSDSLESQHSTANTESATFIANTHTAASPDPRSSSPASDRSTTEYHNLSTEDLRILLSEQGFPASVFTEIQDRLSSGHLPDGTFQVHPDIMITHFSNGSQMTGPEAPNLFSVDQTMANNLTQTLPPPLLDIPNHELAGTPSALADYAYILPTVDHELPVGYQPPPPYVLLSSQSNMGSGSGSESKPEQQAKPKQNGDSKQRGKQDESAKIEPSVLPESSISAALQAQQPTKYSNPAYRDAKNQTDLGVESLQRHFARLYPGEPYYNGVDPYPQLPPPLYHSINWLGVHDVLLAEKLKEETEAREQGLIPYDLPPGMPLPIAPIPISTPVNEAAAAKPLYNPGSTLYDRPAHEAALMTPQAWVPPTEPDPYMPELGVAAENEIMSGKWTGRRQPRKGKGKGEGGKKEKKKAPKPKPEPLEQHLQLSTFLANWKAEKDAKEKALREAEEEAKEAEEVVVAEEAKKAKKKARRARQKKAKAGANSEADA